MPSDCSKVSQGQTVNDGSLITELEESSLNFNATVVYELHYLFCLLVSRIKLEKAVFSVMHGMYSIWAKLSLSTASLKDTSLAEMRIQPASTNVKELVYCCRTAFQYTGKQVAEWPNNNNSFTPEILFSIYLWARQNITQLPQVPSSLGDRLLKFTSQGFFFFVFVFFNDWVHVNAIKTDGTSIF